MNREAVKEECAMCGSIGPRWSHLIRGLAGDWMCKHRRACEARQMLARGESFAAAAAHAQRLARP